MSIFLSIAAYCDPLLHFTVSRALATARHPERLHLGIVDQSPAQAPRLAAGPEAVYRMSYVRIDPVDARGPCWARAIAMSLYAGEDWFFQIDSHTDFDPHWDERLVAQAGALALGRPGFAISAYPHPFVLEDGKPVHKPTTPHVLSHVVKPGAAFEAGHPVLGFEAHPVDRGEPVPGFHLGAGCLFAPGHIAQDIPYDPHLYFHGEEQALALRLFTHGWDIFHVPGLPVYHLYNAPGSGAPARPMHWDPAHDAHRRVTWHEREQRSRQRLSALVEGAPLGVYGLGRRRSLADYADFSGIDYAARTLAPRAFQADR
jgi:hypothetical protein